MIDALLNAPAHRIPGIFLESLKTLDVTDDGLAPGHSLEQLDVVATLALVVEVAFRRSACNVPQVLMCRLAAITQPLLATALTRSDDDRQIVAEWRVALSEALAAI
jgi:hypothetical protein